MISYCWRFLNVSYLYIYYINCKYRIALKVCGNCLTVIWQGLLRGRLIMRKRHFGINMTLWENNISGFSLTLLLRTAKIWNLGRYRYRYSNSNSKSLLLKSVCLIYLSSKHVHKWTASSLTFSVAFINLFMRVKRYCCG